jgi:hypothetical protein
VGANRCVGYANFSPKMGMVGAIGFEFWGGRSFSNIESAAGTLKQWQVA